MSELRDAAIAVDDALNRWMDRHYTKEYPFQSAEKALHKALYGHERGSAISPCLGAHDPLAAQPESAPLDECGYCEAGGASCRLLWPDQRKCCPDCTHAVDVAAQPESAGLDVTEASRVLLRAGWVRGPNGEREAREYAAVILLTAITGERYDLDDDHLTPDQRERLARLTAEKP